MIRLVCPYCHAPLSGDELEMATLEDHACLVCPECSGVLVTDRALADVTEPIRPNGSPDV